MKLTMRTGALMILSLGALTSCAVEDGGGVRPRPTPSMPQMCTMEYDPVCASDRGERRTFSNACQARADGYRIVGRGECRPSGRPDFPDRDRPGHGRPDFGRPDDGRPDRDRPKICTREYQPVCARQGRREQTFSNSCMAEADGFRVVGNGACRSDSIRPVDDSGMRPRRDRVELR